MIDYYASQLATILTGYSTTIQRGDLVVIGGPVGAEPLIEALVVAVLERGGNPHVTVELPNLSELYMQHAADDQLAYLDPISMARIEEMDVIFRILAFANTKDMTEIDPNQLRKAQEGRRPLMERYRERREEEAFQWCVCPWPTQAMAQDAEMGLMAYRDFVFRACGLFEPDPIAYWEGFRDRQLAYVDWLRGKEELVITGPGIDLKMSVAGRTWVSAHGAVNFPDGEIFTGPVEDSVNGEVDFSFPTVYQGHLVEGVHFSFKDGKVVDASATKGEAFLFSQLDADPGARFLGEIAIGTNPHIQRFTGNTLFDEKIGGTVHMAVGQSYAETGGQNKSLVHWDIVHNMRNGGAIHVDGELMYHNGDFVI